MNLVVITGRLCRDPELRFVPGSGKAVCTFSLAVKRPHTKNTTDFFSIVVWNKPGEDAANYLARGRKVAVRGYLTSRSYEDKAGQKRYVTEVAASEVEYLEWGERQSSAEVPEADGFIPVEDDDDIPF